MSHDCVKTAILGRIDHAFDTLTRHLPEPPPAVIRPGARIGEQILDLDAVAQAIADEEALQLAKRIVQRNADELRALGYPDEANNLEVWIKETA